MEPPFPCLRTGRGFLLVRGEAALERRHRGLRVVQREANGAVDVGELRLALRPYGSHFKRRSPYDRQVVFSQLDFEWGIFTPVRSHSQCAMLAARCNVSQSGAIDTLNTTMLKLVLLRSSI